MKIINMANKIFETILNNQNDPYYRNLLKNIALSTKNHSELMKLINDEKLNDNQLNDNQLNDLKELFVIMTKNEKKKLKNYQLWK